MTRMGRWILVVLMVTYWTILMMKPSHAALWEFASFYLTDLLCLPILLSLTLILVRRWFRGRVEYLTLAQVVFVWLYLSVVFEWVLPSLSTRYVSDPLDVMYYAIGGLVFLFFQTKLFKGNPRKLESISG